MKFRREGSPPEQNALRSRGCPNPDYALVTSRSRKSFSSPGARRKAPVRDKGIPLGKRLAAAAGEMRDAQNAVADLKAAGLPYQDAARAARLARSRWIEVRGGLETHAVEAAGYEAPSR